MEVKDIIPNLDIASQEYWEARTYEEIKKRTYLDPLYDAAFKAFLGDEQALISFLNGVFHLEDENKITKVTVKNTEVNIIFPKTKTYRFDIRATTSNGFCINVEMQKAKHSRFIERILLQHSAFMLQSKYEWDQEFLNETTVELTSEERSRRHDLRYEIPPTIAIWICDFPLEKQDGYCATWAIRNEKGLTLTDKVKYILYDLTQFNKELGSVKTDEDRWLYLLKHAGSASNLPDFNDETIARAIKRLLVSDASDRLLKEQARNMVMTEEELDYLAALKVRARTEGRAEGRVEGRAEGRAEGQVEARKGMALSLRNQGVPISAISAASGLSEQEILALK